MMSIFLLWTSTRVIISSLYHHFIEDYILAYEITVETSSAPDAGCDAYVYIKITGDGGAQEFLLDKYS